MDKVHHAQASMRQLNFTQYFLKYGMRSEKQMMDPMLRDQKLFAFPQHSIYHHWDHTGISLGPGPNEFVFSGYTKSIYYSNVTELTQRLGAPRQAVSNPATMERDMRKRNQRLRPVANIEAVVRDGNTLLMFNYNLIARMWRYTRSTFATYYAWHNTFSTIIDKMVEVAGITSNHQFMLAYVPAMVPSLTQFNKAAHHLDNAALANFKDHKAFMALDIWKWLSEDRKTSILSAIPEDKLKLINFVFIENGQWAILNLGYLNSLRRPDDAKAWKDMELGQNSGHRPEDVQKRFLMMLMGVMKARTVVATDASDQEGQHIDEISKAEFNKDVVQAAISEQVTEDISDTEGELAETEAEKAIRIQAENRHIDETLSQLEEINEQRTAEDTVKTALDIMREPTKPHTEVVKERLNKLADQNILTAAEYKRMMAIANKVHELPSPDGKTNLHEYSQVKIEDLKIDHQKVHFQDNPTVLDKSMLKSSLEEFDTVYRKKALDKHVAAMCVQLNRGGYLVTNFTEETQSSALGVEKNYSLQIQPIEGAVSTVRFKLPVLDDDGNFTANGSHYRISKQWGDTPIRKISPTEVALSSYYGKSFVERGRKKATNAVDWYHNQITAQALSDDKNVAIDTIIPGDVFDKDKAYPKDYSTIAMSFKAISVRGVMHYFSLDEARKAFGDSLVDGYYKSGACVLAQTSDTVIYIDKEGAVCSDGPQGTQVLGPAYRYLQLEGVPPIEYAEIGIFGQAIPIGIVLAYYKGFTGLMKMLGVTPVRTATGTRVTIDEHTEFRLDFEDEVLVFNTEDRLATMILAGFRDYHKAIRSYPVHTFDQKAVYANLLESKQIAVRYLRELDQMEDYFIDPITHDILQHMGEPTNWQGLLIRAVQLMLDDRHYSEIDARGMRVKGAERMAGAVYTELMNAIRQHAGSPGRHTKKVEMNPYAVWKGVVEDAAKFQLSEINPIQQLKEVEALTWAGTGGRGKESMVRDTRYFDPTHMGIVSEATKDSSDVGVNIHLSPNAKLTNAYGMVEMFDPKKDGISSVISTAALLAPGSDGDDQKRVGFVSIQMAHAIAADGYHQPTIRTGYETVIGQRTNPRFCTIAKKPGVVKAVNPKGIIVVYDDKEEKGYEIGRYYGNAAGLTIPHMLVTNLKEGQKFQPGDAICYNQGFFEPDLLNPKRIVYKCSMDVRTVLWESTQTLEDATCISPRLAQRSITQATKVKTVVVKFTDVINKLITTGTKTEYDTPICYITDSVVSNAGAFDEETMDSLSVLKSQTPRAGAQGTVERIEVYYHGELEDMSESLQAAAIQSDKAFKARAQDAKKPVYSGKVDSGFRIDGTPLGLDEVAIQIYITTNVGMGLGDKGVFCNQLKTIVSETMTGDYKTEQGALIDAVFGWQSVDARIVTSAYRIGLGSLAMRKISELAVQAYES